MRSITHRQGHPTPIDGINAKFERYSILPTGTVTFLFTDIEGSTHLWEQYPEAMKPALARHDALLRQAVESHGGHVVKTTGDGLYAVFGAAHKGAEAMIAGQRSLQAEPWESTGPLRVRMALHTGEVEERQGDYFGPALNRTARLMAAASGGQMLLSLAASALVQGQLPDQATLRDLGEQRLRDLSRPERVFQLVTPDLPTDFPPLKTLTAIPNNLPLQLTSFIGREREIAELKQTLSVTRLLTLIGSGGTGKTRLALQACAEALPDFPNGVWLVELAPLADPELILETIASIFGLRQLPGSQLKDQVVDYLRAKHLLLILDNCEHLIEACARLADMLLRHCAQLKIVASSREALGITGESIYRVPSLSIPESIVASAESLRSFEAVQLFVERATAVQPRFALTAANAPSLAQLCRRLDGIPLALELAAARISVFSVEQIAARLDDRFRLLTGGSRTALPRQQTLRALIDWSYDLLPAAKRKALNRLSVFAGGWTYEAAEAVIGPEALDLLAYLVDKSLVVAEETAQAGETRYRLLETIRQYARDKLLESGESPTVRDLHLETYLHLAVDAEPKLEGPELLPWLDRLEAELDNFRAALEWALDRNPEAALQLAASLLFFWRSRSSQNEGRRWLSESLTRMDALPAVNGEAKRQCLMWRARGLSAGGMLAFAMGELNAARALLEESADLARQSGALRTLGEALGMLGFTVVWLGDAAAAEAVVEEGLRLCQETNDRRDIVAIKIVQANQAAQFHHDFAAAGAHIQEVRQLLREDLRNPWLAAMAFLGSASMSAFQGNYIEAIAQYQEGETLFRQLGDRHMVNAMQSERAHIERQLGHYPQAVALYSKTLPGWQGLGHRAALAHELECFAFIAVAQAQPQRAARLLGRAEALRESIDSPMRASEHAEYDQNVSALRAQMDDSAFAAAWAEGRAMMMEQAIALALESTSSLPINHM